ncbi:MAG: PPOX class F420-dependent oxidoreductase [Acidobacteriota bacterium]
MSQSKLSQFSGETYLCLESFRKSGEGIKTPLWFVESDGLLYVYSLTQAAKVRRVRNNPHVRVVPCNIRGRVKGKWLDATATLLDEEAGAKAHELLTRKYGLIKRIGDLFSKWRRRSRTAMAIRIDENQ